MLCPVRFFLADDNACAWIDAFAQRLHCNATVNRANNRAKITAYAFFVDDLEFSFAVY